MNVDPRTALENSALYRFVRRLYRLARENAVVGFVLDARVQQVTVALVLAASSIVVLSSSLDAAVRFLSFLALFAVTASLVWTAADPLGEGSAVADDGPPE